MRQPTIEKDEICGNCKYHYKDTDWENDYICVNNDSTNCSEWTDYEDSCSEFVQK